MKRCSISLVINKMQIRKTNEQITLLGLSSKRQEITRVGEDVENRKSLCTVGSNINWCSLCGKQYGDSPRSALPRLKEEWCLRPGVLSFLSCSERRQHLLVGRDRLGSYLVLVAVVGKITANWLTIKKNKNKNRTTTWSRTSTPGCLSRENKRASSKIYSHPSAHRNIIYDSQDTEDISVLIRIIDEWIKKI